MRFDYAGAEIHGDSPEYLRASLASGILCLGFLAVMAGVAARPVGPAGWDRPYSIVNDVERSKRHHSVIRIRRAVG